jgi:hypothetical protein
VSRKGRGISLVRRLNQETPSRNCEIDARQRGPESWNTESEDSTAWGAVTRRQTIKTQQAEKI